MELLRTALLQIAPCGTLEGNLKKGIEYCKEAKKMGAHIALFPEMWSCGYDIGSRNYEEWKKEAVPADGPFVRAFGELAREISRPWPSALHFWKNAERDAVMRWHYLIGTGERVFTYAKVHTCEFGAEADLLPGEDFYVADLDTPLGPVKTGAMICYDREFPESARILMLKGAELILVPNACPMEINRLSQLRARAFENMTAICTCNYPGTVPDCNGGSTVFDGVAYLPDLPGSRDMCILQAGSEEGIFLADIDLSMLRGYRESEVHGNAYRRPEKYGLLTGRDIEEPFVRSDHRI